jgi:hypothetical protein
VTPEEKIQWFYDRATELMAEIDSMLSADTKIALVCYNPAHPERDAVFTDGDLDQIIAAVNRRKSSGKTMGGMQ